jgi:Na+/proline symporter
VNAPLDPVRVRRAQVARWSLLANRIGYLLFGLAIALFAIAFAISFNGTMVTLITICLIVGSILLAPSIVLGYAVKAAEKEDRQNGV